jgi:hypothetical protein
MPRPAGRVRGLLAWRGCRRGHATGVAPAAAAPRALLTHQYLQQHACGEHERQHQDAACGAQGCGVRWQAEVREPRRFARLQARLATCAAGARQWSLLPACTAAGASHDARSDMRSRGCNEQQQAVFAALTLRGQRVCGSGGHRLRSAGD